MPDKKYILSKEVAGHKLQRMALEIAEQLDGDTNELILMGIKNNGMVIAEIMGKLIAPLILAPIKIVAVGLDKQNPTTVELIPNNVEYNNKNIIVIDDVANSGRTILYALKPLLSFHPKRIQTLVLVERMHKLFPIHTDYIGLTVATTLQDHIQVEVVNGEVLGAFL